MSFWQIGSIQWQSEGASGSGQSDLDDLAARLEPTQLRAARRFAVQFLYGIDISQESGFDQPRFSAFCLQLEVPADLTGYLTALVRTVVDRLQSCDELIRQHCHNWKLSRMSRVDLSTLRVCTAELLARPQLPVEIAIADAAEIGKEFGNSSSSAFVNGVLDGVARELRASRE